MSLSSQRSGEADDRCLYQLEGRGILLAQVLVPTPGQEGKCPEFLLNSLRLDELLKDPLSDNDI